MKMRKTELMFGFSVAWRGGKATSVSIIEMDWIRFSDERKRYLKILVL